MTQLTFDELVDLSLAEKLGRVSRLWRMAADAQLIPLGLTHPRWTALWKLSVLGDGVSQKELAIALEIELPSLMRTLKQLEDQQLIERHQCIQDKRSRLVYCTAKGRGVLNKMKSIIIHLRHEILLGISAEQVEVLDDLLNILAKNAIQAKGNS